METKQRRAKRAPWTEASLLEAASAAGRDEEIAFLQRLLEHVRQHSGRFSWGSGATAGVTGWYPIAGVDTPVWNVNVGNATTAGYLYYILPEYSTRHPKERIDEFASAVAKVGGLAAKVEQVRSGGWSGWPSLPLAWAAAHAEEALEPIAVATR